MVICRFLKKFLILSEIKADIKGSRRAPTLKFYQNEDFMKIHQIENKTMIFCYKQAIMSDVTK